MPQKAIHTADISLHRNEIMGIAILLVMLFHGFVAPGSSFYGLKRMGNVGVDIFLLLSGIGLWFSWHSHPSLKHFLFRRYLRVYPTWLLLAGAFYTYQYTHNGKLSGDLWNLFGDITLHLDFWRSGDLTFWYIPALMVLYLLAPFYIKAITHNRLYVWLPIVALVWCIAVTWITPLHNAFKHLEIFWSRIPIFFIGINLGVWVQNKRELPSSTYPLLAVVFASSLAVAWALEQYRYGTYPLFINRMLYVPITVSGVLLLNALLNHAHNTLKSLLAFLGSISLELYLIHLHFVLVPLQQLHWGFWATFTLCCCTSIPAAWLVHRFILLIQKNIRKCVPS